MSGRRPFTELTKDFTPERRKRALLHRFGSARAVGEAGLRDLEAVEGISKALARVIYDRFHPER